MRLTIRKRLTSVERAKKLADLCERCKELDIELKVSDKEKYEPTFGHLLLFQGRYVDFEFNNELRDRTLLHTFRKGVSDI